MSKNKLQFQSAKALANISLRLGKISANSACCYIYHQPKMPETIKKMRKF
ncbi:cyclic lactone autoinducer peptide [Dorea sp.]